MFPLFCAIDTFCSTNRLFARDISTLDWDSIKSLLIEEDMKSKEKIDKQGVSSKDVLFTEKEFLEVKGGIIGRPANQSLDKEIK